MEFTYKIQNTLKQRKIISQNILNKNKDKVPIILEKDPKCKLIPIKKTKFMIEKNSTVSKLIQSIRILMKIPQEEGLFLSAKGKYTLTGQKIIGDIYNTYKDEDGFLYIMYTTELIFG